jgi:hypothetical protein
MGVEQHTYPATGTLDLTSNGSPGQLVNPINRGVGIKGQ